MSAARRVAAWAGDWAVLAGLYATAGLWLAALSAGVGTPWRGAAFVFLTAQACYLFDRVKSSAGRLDPADAAAQPERFMALAAHQRAARAWVAIGLLGAAVIGWSVAWWLGLAPLAGAAAVWWYAGRPAGRRARPKDRPGAKAAMTAGAHGTLAGAVLVGMTAAGVLRAGLAVAMILGPLVFADAVVCDLDDLETDRAFGTRSLPVSLGVSAAWAVAVTGWGVSAGGACALAPGAGAAAYGVMLVLTGGLIAAARRRRDLVDARLPLVAAVWWLVNAAR